MVAADLPGQLELDLPARHFDQHHARLLADQLAAWLVVQLARFDQAAVVICGRLQRVPVPAARYSSG